MYNLNSYRKRVSAMHFINMYIKQSLLKVYNQLRDIVQLEWQENVVIQIDDVGDTYNGV